MSEKARTHPVDQAESLEEALIIHRQADETENPRRRFVDNVVLRETSRTAIVASHSAFIDENTGEIHHHAVKLSFIPKLAKKDGGGWSIQVPNHIWIHDKELDEIGNLRDFLSVVRSDLPDEQGTYLVVRLDESQDQAEALRELIKIASSSGKAEALTRSIEAVSSDPVALERLAEFAVTNPNATQVATAALNIGRYRTAVDELERLIEVDALEREFQAHLEKNYWLFGTDYSERLDLRRATRDEIQDFIVRRTTDGYIEVVEIKTPLGDKELFRFDDSHRSYYPGVPLSKVIGQVINYIEKLDANRHMLMAQNGLDVNKIRAKVIIGRDGNDEQVKALRNHNGHLHRIEVLTFDQLLRIGRQIVQYLESVIDTETAGAEDVDQESDSVDALDDVPF